MTKFEFEKFAGYEVSYDDYNKIIEPMYMSLDDVSKEDFVKLLNKKRFALPTKKQYIDKMKKMAKHLHDTCEYFTDYKVKEELEKLTKDYAKRFHNLDWNSDIMVHVLIIPEYYYEEIKRGCTYPKKVIIGYKDKDYEIIDLI